MSIIRNVVELIRSSDCKILHLPYDEARPFSNGRAAVRKGKLWGFIDEDGSEMVKVQFKVVRDFHHGRAAVLCDNHRYMYIDEIGRPLTEPKYAEAGNFIDFGYAEVVIVVDEQLIFDGDAHFLTKYIDTNFNEYNSYEALVASLNN